MPTAERREQTLTPEQFELGVKEMLDAAAGQLDSFEARHRELLPGTDGSYEIDITVRFHALGVQFLVLVECKYRKASIKREVIQVLHDRLRSTGAHKAILFSTSPFQSGAVAYARKHGIALVRIARGKPVMVAYNMLAKLIADFFMYIYWVILRRRRPHVKPPEPCGVVSMALDHTFRKVRLHEPSLNPLSHLTFNRDDTILIGWMSSESEVYSKRHPGPIVTKLSTEPLARFLCGVTAEDEVTATV